MGRASREKGKRGERHVVKALLPLYPHARRGWQAAKCEPGQQHGDVIDVGVWYVEVKNGKQPNIRAALRQAVEECRPGLTPIAFVHDTNGETYAVLRFSDWLAHEKERLDGSARQE